ncbi:adenylate/guanylate cyclase domain-containing protein [Sulfitobacter sp. MF3-043]|uniref:adenylate/guanylate cyclase domain-containing protein n=1 Tax=Sulfitobacter sediminivivens TaxID=3252902 RepID=UPI0036DD30F1
MEEADRINRQALSTRIAQRLSGPAETILGFQTLIVASLKREGLTDSIDDALIILEAAQTLEKMIAKLLSSDGFTTLSQLDDATLRHDLRTPVNAIMGYSELILEETAGSLGSAIENDIRTVLKECGRLLEQVDGLVGFSGSDIDTMDVEKVDADIAKALAQSLAVASVPSENTSGRILVIDDIEANRELLRRNLINRGHNVTTVASASAALELLETTDFELALVDILMPDMNGIDLLGHLKSNPRWRNMAVVMVTGLKDIHVVVKCIMAGADDYLQKPVDSVLLFARVESCLEQVRWRARERAFLAQIELEKSRADGLLLSMLPEMVIKRLAAGEKVIADRFDNATIIFADIVDFTPMVARTNPSELISLLHDLFSAFDVLADQHGIEKIKTVGDAYMAVAGVPHPQDDHADRALEFARGLIKVMADGFGTEAPLKLRVGLNSGPVIGGLIGQKRFVYDVWGEAVNLASRLESSGVSGRIQISQATLDALATPPLDMRSRSSQIKGVGKIQTFILD